MLTLIKINLSGCLNLILCHTLFLILFRQPEKLNAMSLKRLTAFVLPNGKTGLPRFDFVKSRNDTGFCFRLPEILIFRNYLKIIRFAVRQNITTAHCLSGYLKKTIEALSKK